MFNHKKKATLRYQSREPANRLYTQTLSQKTLYLKFQTHPEQNKTFPLQNHSHPHPKKLPQRPIYPSRSCDKNSHGSSSKKLSEPSSKNLSNNKSQLKPKTLEKVVKVKNRNPNKNAPKGKQSNCETQGNRVQATKVYLPNDEYYGKKEKFLCIANTEETLNNSSRCFFVKYKNLVNHIQSMELSHKEEEEELKRSVKQSELKRLKRIHSLEKSRIEKMLVELMGKG